jgi:hypothetical protein
MESFFFTSQRLHKVIEMPYNFVLITLVVNDPDANETDRYHTLEKLGSGKGKGQGKGKWNNTKKKSEITDGEITFAKYSENTEKLDNFFDSWDLSTQNFVLLMKETLDEE